MAHMVILSSAEEVIEALGGQGKAAASLGQKANAVGNWKLRGKIPPEHFLAVSEALRAAGKGVAPDVFGMKPTQSESDA